jgi:hypothetical protein
MAKRSVLLLIAILVSALAMKIPEHFAKVLFNFSISAHFTISQAILSAVGGWLLTALVNTLAYVLWDSYNFTNQKGKLYPFTAVSWAIVFFGFLVSPFIAWFVHPQMPFLLVLIADGYALLFGIMCACAVMLGRRTNFFKWLYVLGLDDSYEEPEN